MADKTEKLDWTNIDPKLRTMIMVGLALGMLMACLDSTIVSTSLKTIAEDLGGMELYAWVFTAYMLCETVMIPIAGKLSDHYGRKPLLIFGTVIFMVGSVLAGLSGSMMELIVFRGMQGIGGGILVPVATAAVADLYSPQARGRMQGILGAIFGVGSAIGPLIGGYLTDAISWHWCFFINIPIGIAVLLLTMKKFPAVNADTLHKIDYRGIGVLAVFLVDLLLMFTWGGDKYAWLSTEIITMALVAAVLLALFIFVERKVDDPVIKPSLFKNHTIVYCAITMLIFGIAMMGTMAYMSIFLQTVLGYTATESGLIQIAMVAGMIITSMSSGVLMARTGSKIWLVSGAVITAAGMLLMSTLHGGSGIYEILAYLFIMGVGLGCMMSVLMTVTQNAADLGEMGMTTSMVNLFRSIGSTVATGLFATFIASSFSGGLANVLPEEIWAIYPHNTQILNYLTDPTLLPYVGDIISTYGSSICYAFAIGSVIMLFTLIFILKMKNDRGVKEIHRKTKAAEIEAK